MARPTKKEAARNQTEMALLQALKQNNMTDKFYLDQVAEYMKYYDDLARLNTDLEVAFLLDTLKEKRQVTKEMRNILAFLGLKPQALEGGGGEDEDL